MFKDKMAVKALKEVAPSSCESLSVQDIQFSLRPSQVKRENIQRTPEVVKQTGKRRIQSQ